MGLDVYASRTPWHGRDDEPAADLSWRDVWAFRRAKIDLDRYAEPGTFSGRTRWDIVNAAYPHHDYLDHDVGNGHEWINPASVRRIADAFEHCDPTEVAEEASGKVIKFTTAHVEGFRRFFRVCARRGLGLVYSH